MSLAKTTLAISILLALGGCGSSSNIDESSRTSDNVEPGSALSASNMMTNGSSGITAENGVSNSGSGDGGEITPGIDFYIDPESPEFIESDSLHFRSAVLGAWAATECQPFETILNAQVSRHSVFVFTNEELVETEYEYESADCSGTPSSKWYPLPIRSWRLGSYRALPDGSGAWELDTSITQRGVYAGDVSADVGVSSYVNIGFKGGLLEFNPLVDNYNHTRPEARSGVYFKKLIGRGLPSIDSEALIGNWRATCTGRLESSYQFFPDKLVITDENWADVGCEGDSYAVRKSTFELEYGAAFVSIFNDTLMQYKLTAVSNELVKFDDSQGFDKPEFKVPLGKTEYRAVTIDNDVLILAYCLYRNSGEDDCQDSAERTPDMVDHNWSVRFHKVL